MPTFPPRLMDHILPSNATKYERSLASQVDRLLALDINFIDLWDPWKCPADLLPYLAWALSVDIWDTNWPISKKREAVARSIRLHRMKGTEQGIVEAVEFAGGKVRKIIVPPAKTFLSAGITPERRAKFLSRYPQLRIYPKRSRGTAKGLFAADRGTLRRFMEKGFPLPSEAFFRALPRVYIWDRGQETELTVLERRWETETKQREERLDLRLNATKKKNHYQPLADKRIFALKSNADKRIYSVHTRETLVMPGDERLARRYIQPSLTPINVVADFVMETGQRKTATFGNAFLGASGFRGFAQYSRAKERTYRRTYIFDSSRALETNGATTFMGRGRLGFPPHHAEITISVRGKAHPFATRRFVSGFTMRSPKTDLERVKQAIRDHKRLSDTILIQHATVKELTAGITHVAGELIAGQTVEVI